MLPTRQPGFARCGVRGRAATRRRGQKGTGHLDRFRPYPTKPYSRAVRGLNERYPLLRLPNFPLRRSAEHSRLKNEESTDFTSVLSFFLLPWLCDCAVCRAYQCAAGLVTVVPLGNWAAPVGRHDLMPPFLPSAQIYSGRVRVSRPTGAEGMSIRNDLQRRGGVTPPYGEIQREKARQRERPGEGTRPYGSRPEKPCRPSHLSDLHPLPRTVMRGNRARSQPQTAAMRQR